MKCGKCGKELIDGADGAFGFNCDCVKIKGIYLEELNTPYGKDFICGNCGKVFSRLLKTDTSDLQKLCNVLDELGIKYKIDEFPTYISLKNYNRDSNKDVILSDIFIRFDLNEKVMK